MKVEHTTEDMIMKLKEAMRSVNPKESELLEGLELLETKQFSQIKPYLHFGQMINDPG